MKDLAHMVRQKSNGLDPVPEPNIRLTFGECTWTYFEFYVSQVPNRFQRWLTKKLLGIIIEEIGNQTWKSKT